MYQALTDYLSEIEKNTSGDWTIHSEEPMPYMVYSLVIRHFEKEVYIFAENHPEYELNHYNDILRENGIEWGAEEMQNADVSQMDGKSVMALLMGAVRGERTCEGVLLSLFETGAIKKWLSRLKEIDG
ncbi:MAG: hypothetical protein HFI03_08225 [Lachnospiraceae bacterium]|jgi:hypothetical protein|nr:hypothetical protein [Lachnospiraceae bacterium]